MICATSSFSSMRPRYLVPLAFTSAIAGCSRATRGTPATDNASYDVVIENGRIVRRHRQSLDVWRPRHSRRTNRRRHAAGRSARRFCQTAHRRPPPHRRAWVHRPSGPIDCGTDVGRRSRGQQGDAGCDHGDPRRRNDPGSIEPTCGLAWRLADHGAPAVGGTHANVSGRAWVRRVARRHAAPPQLHQRRLVRRRTNGSRIGHGLQGRGASRRVAAGRMARATTAG